MNRRALAILVATALAAACGYTSAPEPVSQTTPSASIPLASATATASPAVSPTASGVAAGSPGAYGPGPQPSPSAVPAFSPGGAYGPGPQPSASAVPAFSPGGAYGPGPQPSASAVPAFSPGGAYGPGPQPSTTPGGTSSGAPLPVQLSAAEADGLRAALAIEQHAYATYAQVLVDLGDVRPFVNVLPSEQAHVGQITDLFAKYGLSVGTIATVSEHYASVGAACAAAAQNEQDLVSEYDRLMGTTARTDILNVYGNLQDASRDNHLPAFTRC